MQKLSASKLASHREGKLGEQGGYCALCGDRIPADEPVLDHDHKTGHCRGTLHRGCNAMLGHIENNRPRYKLQGAALKRWLAGVWEYINKDYSDQPLHPTHRTEDQKRERRNKVARARRASAKAGA